MFGKDPKAMERVAPFGGSMTMQQRAALMRERENIRGDSSNSGGGGFVEELRLSEVSTRVRLIPGNFDVLVRANLPDGLTSIPEGMPPPVETLKLEYLPVMKHERFERNSSQDYKFLWQFVCSGGPWSLSRSREQCLGCDHHWTYDKDSRKRSYSSKTFNIFTALDFRKYHEVEQVSKRGKTYKKKVPCTGRACRNCAERKPTVDYHVLPLALGFEQYNTLLSLNDSAGMFCRSCSHGDIQSVAWLCGHCGDAVIDLSNAQLSDADIQKLVLHPMECSSCRKKSYPQELIQCTKCDSPQRATIFDVDMHLRLQKVGDKNILQQTQMSRPYKLGPPFDQIQALPLQKMYKAPNIETQQKIMGIIPWETAPAEGEGGRAYGAKQPQIAGSGSPPPQLPRNPVPEQDFVEGEFVEGDDIPFLSLSSTVLTSPTLRKNAGWGFVSPRGVTWVGI